MKKINLTLFIITSLLIIHTIPVSAETPPLSYTTTLDLTGYLGYNRFAVLAENDLLAYLGYKQSGGGDICTITFYSLPSGTTIGSLSYGAGGGVYDCTPRSLDYNGNGVLSATGFRRRGGFAGGRSYIAFYDVSNPSSISLINTTYITTTSDTTNGQEAYWLTSNKLLFNNWGAAQSDDVIITLSGTAILNGTDIPNAELPSNIDWAEKTYSHGGNILNYDDLENHTIVATSTYGNFQVVATATASPQWLTTDGHKGTTDDDYATFPMTLTSIDFTPFSYITDSEIYGLNATSKNWLYATFTDDLNPTSEDTGVTITNYCTASSCQQFRDDQTFLIFNNSKLAVYEIAGITPTCLAIEGCYMDEPFAYDDNILNHGWSTSGWSVSPVDGEVSCFASSQYIIYEFTPITESVGTFTVDFDAEICGDPTAALNLWLGDGSNPGIMLWFRGDSNNGTIQNFDSSYFSILGTNISDPGGWVCAGFKRYSNHYTLTVYPQNTPKSFDMAVNGVSVAGNLPFTPMAESMSQLSYIYFGGAHSGTKCYWYIDNIKIYSQIEPELNETEIERLRNTFHGIDFSLDAEDPFDDDALCAIDENRNWCFLRILFGGILDSIWRMIVNNPMKSLAALLLIIIVIIGAASTKK